jgi:hypothetical protein
LLDGAREHLLTERDVDVDRRSTKEALLQAGTIGKMLAGRPQAPGKLKNTVRNKPIAMIVLAAALVGPLRSVLSDEPDPVEIRSAHSAIPWAAADAVL